jgi:hypothetical protein
MTSGRSHFDSTARRDLGFSLVPYSLTSAQKIKKFKKKSHGVRVSRLRIPSKKYRLNLSGNQFFYMKFVPAAQLQGALYIPICGGMECTQRICGRCPCRAALGTSCILTSREDVGCADAGSASVFLSVEPAMPARWKGAASSLVLAPFRPADSRLNVVPRRWWWRRRVRGRQGCRRGGSAVCGECFPAIVRGHDRGKVREGRCRSCL